MRALARWGVTPLLAAPLGAHALGFGDIELQSALNQPFQAQIALVATADELQGLKVALAAPEVFERYGIDHPGYLNRFEFRVTTSGGRSVVQVSSREPVTEPFVTLLVEATWARGRRLREYTVLLDPPVLLPGQTTSQAVSPPSTRSATPNSGGGAINRPAPSVESAAPAPRSAEPAPSRAEPAPSPRPSQLPRSTPTPRELPTSAPGGSYGPVRRGEALWVIADRMRPEGVSVNQMMVAVYRANPHAFGGNMNVLHAGATLRLPDSVDLEQLSASVATAEVQKQSDEWLNRAPQARTLRLLPPSDTQVSVPASPPAQAANRAPPEASPNKPASASASSGPATSNANAEENRRLLELRNEQLRNLQNQAAAPAAPAEKPAQAPAEAEKPAAPGVELENERLFTDEASKQDKPAPAPAEAPPPAAPVPAPTPVAAAPKPAPAPSLVSQAIGWLLSPIFLVAIGVAAAILGALFFVRRRRQEPEDVTGRWEALESEVAEDEARDTARLRRQVPEGSIVVEEGDRTDRGEAAEEAEEPAEPRRAAGAAQRPSRPAAPAPDETMSSQTVINLDQADPVAEADFHMAYGLYDQAAELVQKALDAAPNRRDLKLKLLEVFFVWGNKDAFLSAAQNLRKEIGQKADADWDKVVIMGKQICPDERLFAEATSAAGQVDVDLEAGDSPLDLAFDEAAGEGVDLDLGGSNVASFDLEATGGMPAAPKPAPKGAVPKAAAKSKPADLDGMLDIGERTAAGLESAFQDLDAEEDETSATSPDLDSLAVTQESPTVERPSEANDWAKMSLEDTGEYSAADAPTVETPTIESARPDATTTQTRTVETAFRPESPTAQTRTLETAFRPEAPTVEQPAIAGADRTDLTAEIDLDDLGLDLKDIEGLPQDLGDLPAAAEHETDTREQPGLGAEDDLLSATGVTHVLHDEDVGTHEFETRQTAVLADDEATMLAPSVRDSTMTGTEVLEHRLELDETGSTSLVSALRPQDKEGLDLNLDDFAQALHGADTVEQPRTAQFSRDVFGGGNTPVDMDIGIETVGSDDPTGTEEVSPLDPQTMTEVGTKLDLARAYIDMGDPEGARSILEEVLDEGDPGQRREAQGLIDVLSA
jgi:pilus assembly protein FimV